MKKKILFLLLFLGMTYNCFSFPKYKCVMVVGVVYYCDLIDSSSTLDLETGDYFHIADRLIFPSQDDAILAADSTGALFFFFNQKN